MAKGNVEKIRLNAVSHSVRAAQAVLQYGVGAMVDFPSQTLMTAAPKHWNDEIVRIHDERLEKSLICPRPHTVTILATTSSIRSFGQ